MSATVIGLDVGTSAVRAVEIDLSDPPEIRRMGQVGLPVGAVVDGEVADVAAVSVALQRLWSEVGFKSKDVRVGMSSARVIVRTIEMPRLPHDELMSTIKLQLDDYVPLPADETVFDIRPIDGSDSTGQTQLLLLAATHHDAVQPLVMALLDAHLRVVAVDVIPAALALALTRSDPEDEDGVDIVLSIGAGTVVVVAANAGEALFSRTLTSANGRRTTERIASELAVGLAEAEMYKRLGAANDPSATLAMMAAEPSVQELTDEVAASIAFYGEQPSARRVRRLIVTGGGSLLPGLRSALNEQLGVDVVVADPFANVRLGQTGFEPCDLPYLAPYMAAAVGVALGATRPKERRINLTPLAKRTGSARSPKRLLVGVGAFVLVGAAGAMFVSGRAAIADEQSRLTTATAQLSDLQARIEERDAAASPTAPTDDSGSSTAVGAADVAASVASTDIDWIAVEASVAGTSAPLGIAVTSFQGVFDPPQAAATTIVVAPTTATGAAPPVTAPPVEPTPQGPLHTGSVTLSATAPSLTAIADWLDSIATDTRFTNAWTSGISMTAQPDGSTSLQFTMEIDLTDENLVVRSAASEVPA